MMSSLKRRFPSVLQGAECLLNYFSSTRRDSGDYFMKGMKHLDSLDQNIFSQDLDGFHLFGEILALNSWWLVSKVTCPDKYSHYFFLQFFHPTPIPFAKCGSILKHTHIFSSDNIWMRLDRAWNKPHKVNGKLPMVSLVFGWGYYYTNSWGCLVQFKRRATLDIMSGAFQIICWQSLK